MQKSRFSVQEIVCFSLLIALNIVLTRMASIRIPIAGIETIRIGFGAVPVIFAGYYFGAKSGGVVGAIGDFVGFWINPMGAYMPHFTLTAALTGIIPALILKIFKSRGQYHFWQLLIAIGIGQFITSVLLVPYFLHMLYGIPFLTTIPAQIQAQVIQVPLYAMFVRGIAKRLALAF